MNPGLLTVLINLSMRTVWQANKTEMSFLFPSFDKKTYLSLRHLSFMLHWRIIKWPFIQLVLSAFWHCPSISVSIPISQCASQSSVRQAQRKTQITGSTFLIFASRSNQCLVTPVDLCLTAMHSGTPPFSGTVKHEPVHTSYLFCTSISCIL